MSESTICYQGQHFSPNVIAPCYCFYCGSSELKSTALKRSVQHCTHCSAYTSIHILPNLVGMFHSNIVIFKFYLVETANQVMLEVDQLSSHLLSSPIFSR